MLPSATPSAPPHPPLPHRQGQVSARLAVMEAQLEEQGRLLRALLAAAGPCPPSPDEQT